LADDACGQPLDRRRHAWRAKTLVVLAPADDAVLGHDLDEVVVPPAGVACERFDASDLGGLFHDFLPRACCCGWADNNNGSAGRSIVGGRKGRSGACMVRPAMRSIVRRRTASPRSSP